MKKQKIHKMSLKEKYFYLIFKGEKRIELRLNDYKRKLINPGDKIEFRKGKNENSPYFTVNVKALIKSTSFKELATLLKEFNILELTGFDNIDDLCNTLNEFYSKEDQDKFGVVGICVGF